MVKPTPHAIEVRLFGLPRLSVGQERLHLSSRKAMALLALLALDGAAPRERLAQVLWPELDLASARRNLRREVFRLRDMGLALNEAVGDALVLDPDVAVDAMRCRAAAACADDGLVLQLSGALLLDGLEGVAGDGFEARLAKWRAEFMPLHALARSRRAAALERDGDLAAALALQLRALDEEPCDEAAACAAMRLLNQQGERDAAMALYTRLLAALRDEFGMDPAPATRALATELRGAVTSVTPFAAAPPAAVAGTPALLAAKLPFVDRPALQAQIQAAWQAGRRVYLSGVPGVGKTRLASECAAARGPWLLVACAPNDQEVPYSSAVRALRGLRESAPDVAWPDWVRRELAQVMPELGAAPQPLASDEARARLAAAFAAAWAASVHDNFQAVVLDDWHWCDAASVDLARQIDDHGVRWIVAYRSAQLPAAALQRMHADVDSRKAEVVQLQGLEQADVLALVRLLSGSPGGALFAQRLHRATEGNPFFLIETLRYLSEQGLLSASTEGGWHTPFDAHTQDYAELPVPPTVRDTVQGRVRALGPAAQRLLEAASLLGDRFETRTLEAALPALTAQSVALLEHATAARLIAPVGESPAGAYRFAHDLVRQCLADGLSPARRRRLHEQLAQALQVSGAPPALIAQQLEGAGQGADAVRWRMTAAHAAWRVHAWADALLQYAQGLADGGTAEQAVQMHLGIAQVYGARGDAAAVEAALVAAVHAAHDADAATRLSAQLARAEHWCQGKAHADGLALLDALAGDVALAAPALRARALAARAQVLRLRGQLQTAVEIEAQAITLLSAEPGAALQLAELLSSAARTALRQGDAANSAALAQRAVAAYGAVHEPGGLAGAWVIVGVAALFADRPRAEIFDALERARSIAAACGHVPHHRSAILNLIKLQTDAGNTAAALTLLDEGEALAPGFEHARAQIGFLEARYFVHYLRGELTLAQAAAERLLAASDDQADITGAIGSRQMVVDLYLHRGDLAKARQLLAEAQVAAQAAEAGGGHVYRAALLAKQAWLALAEGRPSAALALLNTPHEATCNEDRAHLGWVGAAAALALGLHDDARRRLAAIDIHADTPTDVLAHLLVQRLVLARATCSQDAEAQQRAHALLAQGRVPVLEAQLLQRALLG